MEPHVLSFLVLSLEIPRLPGHVVSVCATLEVIHHLGQWETCPILINRHRNISKKWVRYLSWQWYQLQNLEGFSIHYLFGVAFDWFMCLPKKANNLQVLLKKRICWNCKILIGWGGPFRSSIQGRLEKGGITEDKSQGTLCGHSNVQSPMKDLLWEGVEKGPPLYYVKWNHKQEIRETLKPLLPRLLKLPL